MTLLKRYIVVILISLAWLPSASQVQAQVETEAPYAILLDVETQTVLFEKKADELMQPASMSKLMTLAVVFDAIEKGKITLQSEMRVSEFAWRTGGAPSGTSAMFAPLNTAITVEDLLRGVIIQSGNDACIILAEGLAGSEEAFAREMTEHARRLGLKKSTFGNSTGLPHPNQLMTARELAFLSLHLITHYPQHYAYFQQREFPYRKHKFYNRNPLIAANIGADGLKTGFTEESGYGLVGSAVQDGRRLLVVVNGLKTDKARREEAVKLLNWGFRSFEKVTLFKADEPVAEALVWGGEKRYVSLRGKGDLQLLLPKNIKQRKLRGRLTYLGPVIAPVTEGDRIGELRVRTEDGIESSAPLYAAESIERAGIVRQGIDSALTLAFGWLIRRGGDDE
jgi:serine-type D-Ala-D-Ala carboxypeptidase (penicillin-binding protein 5/6)